MNPKATEILSRLIGDFPALEPCRPDIESAYRVLEASFAAGKKLLVCGNGGSAADSEHIVGELMKGFLLKRVVTAGEAQKIRDANPDDWEYLAANLQRAFPTISLVSQTALSTAFGNDVAPDMVFAQQVFGYGAAGDVLIAISTSGNSANVVNAVKTARAFGVKTVGLTGAGGGLLERLCDSTVRVPSSSTYHRIQEYHLSVYHALCAMLEAAFFDE